MVDSRIHTANALTSALRGISGIETPDTTNNSVHTFWKYCLNVDESVITGGAVGLGSKLREQGIACAPRYIQKPAFRCRVFSDQVTFGSSQWPFNLARPEAVNYEQSQFPGTFRALEQILVLPWNEKYTQEHVDFIANAVHTAAAELNTTAAPSDNASV